ncbi:MULTISPECIES: hypothetical protein [unclassified Bradyrhizobium]|uniref:hypothetical protein n=1 Tax=unclassified Bradyrhizobium TaxID=2631580 RepID=UPI001FF81E5D|nr:MULTISPECIES: hypothetical protein [unclassified Bradyrhizobium]MCK1346351.1 hypothetical protein [Bradyrhizobium sp. CW11]MCK1588544.1 hypothetical protein [Bradyrhizobium sp. 169]
MTKESLQNQADRAEALAAQASDDQVRETLLKAAREYREQLKMPRRPAARWVVTLGIFQSNKRASLDRAPAPHRNESDKWEL